jgi:ribosomal 50S subunit-recycling heat shock protein
VKSFSVLVTTACITAAMGLAEIALAQAPMPAPRGEGVVATAEATATVTKIDYETRAVTVRMADGGEQSFVASEDVRNLSQVKAGDLITVTYGESFVYEVKKGGSAVEPQTAMAGTAAEPGARPAGVIARQTTATVLIKAIDKKVPSVTFAGPAGNTRTIKVLHPEKLEGVSVGDTVEITYTEALAIKVTATPQQ